MPAPASRPPPRNRARAPREEALLDWWAARSRNGAFRCGKTPQHDEGIRVAQVLFVLPPRHGPLVQRRRRRRVPHVRVGLLGHVDGLGQIGHGHVESGAQSQQHVGQVGLAVLDRASVTV